MGSVAKRGRRPDPAKEAAIHEAARTLFLEQGYSVSIDDIAAAAGVSKQTVYARFASKEELFEAVIRASADQLVGPLFDAAKGADTAEALTAMGLRYCDVILDPRKISMQRLMIAQAQQFPDLARRFYMGGPDYVRRRLAAYLETESAAGRLNIDDPEEAASQFLGLVKGADQLASLLGLESAVTPTIARQRVVRAVKAFLKIYGA